MFQQANMLLFTLTVPLKKGTDTVYSELQNSPHGEFPVFKDALMTIQKMTACNCEKGLFIVTNQNYHSTFSSAEHFSFLQLLVLVPNFNFHRLY